MQDLLTNVNLDDRRKALGMSCQALAERSGLAFQTVHRVMHGADATMTTVCRIAEALGLDVALLVSADAESYRQEQAETKARQIVAMVQGTSALEGQAVDEATLQRLRQSVKQDLLKSKRRLWAA